MIYVFAAYALASLVTIGLAWRWGAKAKDEAAHAADRMYSQGKLSDEAIAALVVDRDQWKQKHDVVASRLAAARVRLVSAETQRNKARQDEREHIVEVVRTTDATAAIGILGGVLSNPLPRMPQADPARASDGDRGTAGVQPAGAADASDIAGRVSKP